jgi:hypothetical protein
MSYTNASNAVLSSGFQTVLINFAIMHTITIEELKIFVAAIDKKEATSIIGNFKENFIYSGEQHELIKRMAEVLIRIKQNK